MKWHKTPRNDYILQSLDIFSLLSSSNTILLNFKFKLKVWERKVSFLPPPPYLLVTVHTPPGGTFECERVLFDGWGFARTGGLPYPFALM